MKKRHQQKLVILAIVLTVLFNYPMLLSFSHSFSILGFPAFYFFVFLIWLIAIFITYRIMNKFYE